MNMHPLHHIASQIPEQLIGQWYYGATVYFPQFTAAAAARYQKQKEQFQMIMKRLLSYGDGKRGAWYARARKSPDVTRGV